MQKKYVITQTQLRDDLSEYDCSHSGTEISYDKKGDDAISKVRDYINNNDELEAKKIIDLIFPLREPHIFISHKSEHARHAIRLANVLHSKFGIKSFIDSQVWHHIDAVSDLINQKVSKIREDGKTITYSHKSTSIVASNMFAMLSSSLFDVMDCSDCFIFIDNYSSESDYISKSNIKELKTKSPWIFLELSYADKLRKKMHIRPEILAEDAAFNKSVFGGEGFNDPIFMGFEYSKELIDVIEIKSFKRVFNISRLSKIPLFNLDRIYDVLDEDLTR